MTRTQAWRKVAKDFERAATRDESLRPDVTRYGLCWAISRASATDYETEICRLSKARFGRVRRTKWWPFACDDRPHDSERAIFAGLMAAMTQAERDMLVKGL